MVHKLKLRYADVNGIFLRYLLNIFAFNQIFCLYYKEKNFHFIKE